MGAHMGRKGHLQHAIVQYNRSQKRVVESLRLEVFKKQVSDWFR